MDDSDRVLYTIPSMRYIFLAVLVCVTSLSCLTTTAAQESRRAHYNERISTRTISLNQSVQIEFTTTRPEVPGVDPQSIILSALEVENVRSTWRLLGEIEIEQHEKIKYLKVSFTLLPRIHGELSLPEIPVTWLKDRLSIKQIASFGNVTVSPDITIGNASNDLPKEIDAVGGYRWETPFSVLKMRLGENNLRTDQQTGSDFLHAREGLDLEFRKGQFLAAHLRAAGITLEQARARFIDRWGSAIVDNSSADTPNLLWVIGWLRIEAVEHTDGNTPSVHITVTREDVLADIVQTKLKDQVFNLLDGPEEKETTNK